MICAPLWTMHALLNTLLGLRILRGAFMRLVTFETPAKQSRIGAMTTDDRVVDLHSACALYLRVVENETAFYRLAEALVPPEMRAIFGKDEPVIYPEHLTQELDYELELAVVLKKGGKHFSPEEAQDYVGGYVIFNDITARDIQRREMKSGVFSFCKGIDTFCPLGPWIVTADEIGDAHNLAMELRVNGEPRQRSHSSKMSVKIPEILSHYSPMGYSAGDVVSTGTVSGVAAFSGDPKMWYLKPGDVMECEIENIGILRNRVISWQEAYGYKPGKLGTQETAR